MKNLNQERKSLREKDIFVINILPNTRENTILEGYLMMNN